MNDIEVEVSEYGANIEVTVEGSGPAGPPGPPGEGMQYEIGEGLKVNEQNQLIVDTTNDVEQDNTKPITSAGVFTVVGNVEALLGTI